MCKIILYIIIHFYINSMRFALYIVFLTETNESLNTEILNMMRDMDKLRNKLYEDFRPQIKMLEELQITDEPVENIHLAIATKKVTQIQHLSTILTQDQPDVMAIKTCNKTTVPNLPPNGPLFKRRPEVDLNVLVMKSPVMPWIKAKVCTFSVMYYVKYFFLRHMSILISNKKIENTKM